MSAQVQSAITVTGQLSLASFTLVVYDHATTFAQEVTFFWSGSWSVLRILYLSIRYLTLARVCLTLATNGQLGVAQAPNYLELHWFYVMDYALIFTVMSLCQCIITLRVWHLFPRSRFIRWLAVTIFIVCLVGAVIFGAVKYNAVRTVIGVNDQSNLAQGLPFAFVIYLPALIVHTAMLLLTLYRFHVSPRSLQEHGMIHRFVKEGMLMYAFAAGMLLYEIISLSLTTPEDISVYNVALCGGITVATTVVSICRAMLSIRSLAATYHVDPAWLLNHAELSRVQWRRGVTEGEIYIETNEMDVVLPSKSPASPPGNTGREVQNHT